MIHPRMLTLESLTFTPVTVNSYTTLQKRGFGLELAVVDLWYLEAAITRARMLLGLTALVYYKYTQTKIAGMTTYK